MEGHGGARLAKRGRGEGKSRPLGEGSFPPRSAPARPLMAEQGGKLWPCASDGTSVTVTLITYRSERGWLMAEDVEKRPGVCPNCGYEHGGANYCPSCGAPQEQSAAVAPPPVRQGPPQEELSEERRVVLPQQERRGSLEEDTALTLLIVGILVLGSILLGLVGVL